jgi:hypothetical protein
MAITYSTYTTESGLEFIVRTNEDESISYIPCDESNSDYQAYLDRDKPKAALSTPMVTDAPKS